MFDASTVVITADGCDKDCGVANVFLATGLGTYALIEAALTEDSSPDEIAPAEASNALESPAKGVLVEAALFRGSPVEASSADAPPVETALGERALTENSVPSEFG